MLVKTCPENANVYNQLTTKTPEEEYMDFYDEWVIVQPLEKDVREATTYLTDVFKKGELKDPSKYKGHLDTFRKAVSYSSTYDPETKKLITDMQMTIQNQVSKAITYITHVLVTGKLEDQSDYNSYLNISKRAICYIDSYDDDKTKKLITDMQMFIQTLLNSPKYKNSPKKQTSGGRRRCVY